jgi:hypothetical protein
MYFRQQIDQLIQLLRHCGSHLADLRQDSHRVPQGVLILPWTCLRGSWAEDWHAEGWTTIGKAEGRELGGWREEQRRLAAFAALARLYGITSVVPVADPDGLEVRLIG